MTEEKEVIVEKTDKESKTIPYERFQTVYSEMKTLKEMVEAMKAEKETAKTEAELIAKQLEEKAEIERQAKLTIEQKNQEEIQALRFENAKTKILLNYPELTEDDLEDAITEKELLKIVALHIKIKGKYETSVDERANEKAKKLFDQIDTTKTGEKKKAETNYETLKSNLINNLGLPKEVFNK